MKRAGSVVGQFVHPGRREGHVTYVCGLGERHGRVLEDDVEARKRSNAAKRRVEVDELRRGRSIVDARFTHEQIVLPVARHLQCSGVATDVYPL